MDNDAAALRRMERLLMTAGYRVRILSSNTNHYAPAMEANSPRCAIVDLHPAGRTGLEVQRTLEQSFPDIPIIFISDDRDVPSTVRAMKAGATDFLVKPVKDDTVLDAVCRALDMDRLKQTRRYELRELSERFNSLTPREHEVLEMVVSGRLNKQIAGELGASEKTIKVHRGRIMKKMGVQSVAELVQLTLRLRADSNLLTTPASPGAEARSHPR